MVTGMRGLCNGLGPAMFGVIFYLFHVDLNDKHNTVAGGTSSAGNHVNVVVGNGPQSHPMHRNETVQAAAIPDIYGQLMPGPPFVFGALMVVVAILVAVFIPEKGGEGGTNAEDGAAQAAVRRTGSGRRKSTMLNPYLVYY